MGIPKFHMQIDDSLTFTLTFLLCYNHTPRAGAASSALPWGSVLEKLDLCVEPTSG